MSEMMPAQAQAAMTMIGQSADTAEIAARLKAAGKEKNMAAIDAAAQDFEAMFLTEMIRPMFDEIKPDAMFGGGKGEEIFNSLMLREYGKIMAEAGGIGIAENVRAEMIRIQEEANK